jgi:hypothetical protein
VERTRLQQEPYLVWNAFIDLLAMEEYGDLTSVQRRAHLVLWYDSEVQNGGHGQYFENRGVNRLAETVAALRALGLPDHAQVLSRAIAAFDAAAPGSDWMDALHDGFIEELDAEFHRSMHARRHGGTGAAPREPCRRVCGGEVNGPSNNRLQRTALRAAAEPRRSANGDRLVGETTE